MCCIRCPLILTKFLSGILAPKPFLVLAKKKGFMLRARMVTIYFSRGYVPKMARCNGYIMDVIVTSHVSSTTYIGYRKPSAPSHRFILIKQGGMVINWTSLKVFFKSPTPIKWRNPMHSSLVLFSLSRNNGSGQRFIEGVSR